MFKNYCIIAWRNLVRNKTLSIINISGLALGMAFAILIGMWIQHERSYNGFHKNKDRIAQVVKHFLINNQQHTSTSVMLPVYDELKNNYQEIKHISRVEGGSTHNLAVGDKMLNKNGEYVDPDFLRMMSFRVVNGNLETALNDPNDIVLTASLAAALFGSINVIGKEIKLDNRFTVRVTAVIQDVPKNSSIEFDYLAPFAFKLQNQPDVRESVTRWNNSIVSVLLETKEGIDMEALSRKIAPMLEGKDSYVRKQTLALYPMTRWHLYNEFYDWANTGGRIRYVRLFGIIGLFVLLIACINFMNLSTARSEKRAREVGIRKAVGSGRRQLIIQFLSESLLTVLVAFLLSLLAIKVFLPYLKDLGFEHVRLDFTNAAFWMLMLAVCIATGLIAGSYPAFFLSSFRPVKVLKGVLSQGRGAIHFRKILVVVQFTISITLIISTIVVVQQITHARHRSVGYDPANLVMLDVTDDLRKNYSSLKQELLNTGHIEAVAKASSPMHWVNYDFTSFNWEGKDPTTNMSIDVVMTEWDYEKAAGLRFVAGRPFSPAHKTDSDAVILNEAAIQLIGYKDPIGKTIKLGKRSLTIVGVIENVLMRNPFRSIGATAILFNASDVNAILVRVKREADLSKSLSLIQRITAKYNASAPFEYRFADEAFARKFHAVNQVARLASILAVLAIFISCLGLFGLAMFMAERRAKEICIRKVLGASIARLWLLLSKEFVWLVLVACLLASPLAYWVMTAWLNNYEYRVNINAWYFVLAAVLAIVITLITVSTQFLRAASISAAQQLKAE